MRRTLVVFLVAAGILLALWLRARHPGPATRPVDGPQVAGRPQVPGRWTLAGGAPAGEQDLVVVEGRVIERASGRPIEGATVTLAGVASVEAVSAEDGSFQLLAPRGSRGRLSARHERWFGRGAVVDLQEDPPPQVIALQPAMAVSGRVIDGEGMPVDGAEVHLYVSPSLRWPDLAEPLLDRRAVAGADGTYLIEGVPAGSFRIDAHAPGFSTRKSMILVEEEDVVEDFMLTRAAHLSGRVLDSRGQPLHAPALLYLNGGEQGSTDEHGGFDLADLTAGQLVVTAYDAANGSAEADVELQAGEARNITLELAMRGVAEGTVYHADGRPAVGMTVFVGRALRVRTDEAGHYLVAGLHGGPYSFTVGERGEVLASDEVAVRDGEHKRGVDFKLAEGRHAIAGVVLDGAGQPVPNEGLILRMGELKRRVRCGGDGRFRADGLPDGGGELHLFDGHETVSVAFAQDDAEVRVVLKRYSVLRGTVMGARTPGSFSVRLSGPEGLERARQLTSADGRFELDGVTPGRYTVEVTAGDGSSGTAEVTVGDAPATEVAVRLDPPAEVRGRVVDRNGRPRVDVTVTGSWQGVRTGADGRFILPVKPGTFELSFQPDEEDVVADSRMVTVASGARVDVGAITLLEQRLGNDDETPGFDGMEAVNRDGQATVASVDPDSSAARAGIVAGDLLFAVDGNDVSNLGGASIDELLRGTAGATVEVTFAHPDGEAQTVRLVLTASAEPND